MQIAIATRSPFSMIIAELEPALARHIRVAESLGDKPRVAALDQNRDPARVSVEHDAASSHMIVFAWRLDGSRSAPSRNARRS